jgi:hypothetical protein
MVYSKTSANHPPLTKGVKQHVPDTFTGMAETVFWFAQCHQAETLKTAPGKKYYGCHKDAQKYAGIK